MTPGRRGGMGDVRSCVDVPLEPAPAFDALLEDLRTALGLRGIRLEDGQGGRLVRGEQELGRITEWEPGRRAAWAFSPTTWPSDQPAAMSVVVEPIEGGTRVTVEQRGLGSLLGGGAEAVGWFASEAVAPLLASTAPDVLGDWITDRRARRPTGAESRAIYGDPLYHRPGFRVLLDELALTASDHLLEVGCGGGALLAEALRTGCRAAAVDHSPEMVDVARTANAEAIADGRLDVCQARAEALPFEGGTFTCATMTGVLGFLTDPVAVLAEMRRVLAVGGRLVVAGSDPELRGTPGAPEPMASRLRFYDDDELAGLGREAGFEAVRVVRHDLEGVAREVGIPEEHVPLFSGPSRFLLARKG